MKQRIACSPLTGRIYLGRINEAGDAFIGDKTDVTSDVMRAVVERAEFSGGEFVINSSDGASFRVRVEKIKSAQPEEPS